MKKLVSFKVEPGLAEFLDSLPNKSEFVRAAIIAQFGSTCPLCTGSGVVARGIGEHYAEVFQRHGTRACVQCGTVERVPRSVEGIDATERSRVEQFLHGGPLYCARCYANSPKCGVCGWHLPVEGIADHHRKHHKP